jgi:hypothetical protein
MCLGKNGHKQHFGRALRCAAVRLSTTSPRYAAGYSFLSFAHGPSSTHIHHGTLTHYFKEHSRSKTKSGESFSAAVLVTCAWAITTFRCSGFSERIPKPQIKRVFRTRLMPSILPRGRTRFATTNTSSGYHSTVVMPHIAHKVFCIKPQRGALFVETTTKDPTGCSVLSCVGLSGYSASN